MRLGQCLGRAKRVNVLRKSQTLVVRFDQRQSRRRAGPLADLDAEPREPLELGNRRWPNPAKEVPRNLRVGLGVTGVVAVKRVWLPSRLLVALLIEPPVDGDTPELTPGLQ